MQYMNKVLHKMVNVISVMCQYVSYLTESLNIVDHFHYTFAAIRICHKRSNET